MVTHFAARSGNVFGAIADPTRRAILDELRTGSLTAGELADRFPVSRPAISRHLRVLRIAGLVVETRFAQSRIYSLDPAPLLELDKWIAQYRIFWPARLQALKTYVEGEAGGKRTAPQARGRMQHTTRKGRKR